MGRKKYNKGSQKPKTESTSNKPYTSGKSEEQAVPDKEQEVGKERTTNDPEWYARDPQLVLDAASVPYSEPLGSPINFGDATVNTTGLDLSKETLSEKATAAPGIMVLTTKPSFGHSIDRMSPANVAATALYSQVRYVNNGRKNYDPADLFMYVMSVTDLYSAVSWVQRIYGAAFLYSQSNKYIGKSLLVAMGVNPDSVLHNLANFRYWINTFINKISSYAIPQELTLVYRRAFQYKSVYIEHENVVKDQLYMYKPLGFYKFQLDPYNKGMLRFVKVPSSGEYGLTIEDIERFCESLLDNIFGDEDFGLMSGDIMKAFDNKIIGLESIPEDYAWSPVYDRNVLWQMKNSIVHSTIVCGFDPALTPDPTVDCLWFKSPNDPNQDFQPGHVYQDSKGNLILREIVDKGMVENVSDTDNEWTGLLATLVTTTEDGKDPGTTIEILQNAAKLQSTPNSVYNTPERTPMNAYDIIGGANIVTYAQFFYHYGVKGADVQLKGKTLYQMCAQSETLNNAGIANGVAMFKYAPNMFTFYPNGVEVQNVRCISNIDVYALLTTEQTSRILEVSMLSLLYVPGVAKFVNTSM